VSVLILVLLYAIMLLGPFEDFDGIAITMLAWMCSKTVMAVSEVSDPPWFRM
jgi:hypothetical protein